MTRCAELTVLTGRSHFAEQIFKSVAHDVLGSGTFTGAGKQLVNGIDGIAQHLALVGIKLKVGIRHAVVETGQFGIIFIACQALIYGAQPRKNLINEMHWISFFLPDIAPPATGSI